MNAILEPQPAGVTLVVPVNPLASMEAIGFQKWMESILPGATHIVMDLSRVQFMDSAGCGVLLWLHARLHETGARLTVCGLTPPVRALFDLLRIRRVLHLAPMPFTPVTVATPA